MAVKLKSHHVAELDFMARRYTQGNRSEMVRQLITESAAAERKRRHDRKKKLN